MLRALCFFPFCGIFIGGIRDRPAGRCRVVRQQSRQEEAKYKFKRTRTRTSEKRLLVSTGAVTIYRVLPLRWS
ncbi:hypothetical protein BIW11_06577 [Tropilaelaps mercedesae]|uniref:Uncharacterized protein n=1 Tax=Tropilaelaps mercedesae TaxID=418985 RepID=A0A1V9XXD5_9ACAR|nr:hypothetical protein BIW11_06577 [Tropilaelaps mercedesae]